MLKQTAESTAPILSKLINISISKGKFPREWKTARVVPIPKPGSEKDTTVGYRPISILPIASKIIERHGERSVGGTSVQQGRLGIKFSLDAASRDWHKYLPLIAWQDKNSYFMPLSA